MITQAQIDKFVADVQKLQNQHFASNFSNLTAPTVSAEIGRKYVRIVLNGSQRSVFCFVDRNTGDILKAASWAAPAKHARGHINNGSADVTPYGAHYM